MALFTISDLHLSQNSATDKSMEVFGKRWHDYVTRLKKNWTALISDKDTVVLAGDISWALSAEEAVEDFLFLESLPGKKIVGKGNHDFWWQTMRKLDAFKEKNKLSSISFLYNNAFLVEDFIVCGTRGWFYDPSCDNIPADTDFNKIIARETVRLRLSLDEACKLKEENPDKEILVFLHFPVIWSGKASEEILAVLKEYNIRRVYYGHIHGSYETPSTFDAEGIHFCITSADFLHFTPILVAKKPIL